VRTISLTISLTSAQWQALDEYLGNVEFREGDRIELSGHAGGNVVARCLDAHGCAFDQVEVNPKGES
jgi:hypothetical protein